MTNKYAKSVQYHDMYDQTDPQRKLTLRRDLYIKIGGPLMKEKECEEKGLNNFYKDIGVE